MNPPPPQPSPPQPSSPAARPKSPSDLFWSFSWLALQGFGGVLAVVQRELVERKRWMTNAEFVEDWAVAQVMPGPNVVNLALMIGDRHFGLRGAVAAVTGMLTFPLLVMLALALLHAQWADHPAVAGALRGMGAVAAALVAVMGIKLAAMLRHHPLGWPLCAALALLAFVAVAVMRWPLHLVLLVLGGGTCLATWRKLRP